MSENRKRKRRSEASSSEAHVEPPEHADADDVTQKLENIRQLAEDIDQELSLNTQNDGDERMRKSLAAQSDIQRRLVPLGRLVGQQGTTEQTVQDARLTHRINGLTIPVIKSIKINRTLWNAKTFQTKLMEQIHHVCTSAEEDEEQETQNKMDESYCRIFVTEYLGQVVPGYTPVLASAYGAIKAPAVKPDPKPRAPRSQKEKEDVTKKPKNVQKLTDGELNVATDPTMQRVTELYETIVAEYQRSRLPLCLIALLVQRDSYHASVQNFFCFSFLVKDGKVRMWLDENKLPVCVPVSIPARDDGDDEEPSGLEYIPHPQPELAEAGEKQFTVIMNLTEERWRQLIDAFELNNIATQ